MVGGTSCSSSDRLADSNGNNSSSCIPDDLIIEVLSRLSDKALVRSMCVSKSWRNLIANSLPPSPMSGLLLIFPSRQRPYKFIPLLRSGSNCLTALRSHCTSLRTTVIHYCNGVFLLSGDARDFRTSYYVCNPATNQCVALPEPPPFSYRRYHHSALAFDPRKSSHYKVVRIGGRAYSPNHAAPINQLQVQVFSSDKNQWVSFIAYSQPHCTCESKGHLFLDWPLKQLIYLNGALHFLCDRDECMISLYVEEKRFGEFKLLSTTPEPELPTPCLGESEGRPSRCLGESGGRLYYVACHLDKLKIWMLQSLDPDKWFEKHTLHIANLGKDISPSNGSEYLHILAFHANLEVLFINKGGVIYSCYFGSGMEDIDRLKEICNLGHHRFVDFVSLTRAASSL